MHRALPSVHEIWCTCHHFACSYSTHPNDTSRPYDVALASRDLTTPMKMASKLQDTSSKLRVHVLRSPWMRRNELNRRESPSTRTAMLSQEPMVRPLWLPVEAIDPRVTTGARSRRNSTAQFQIHTPGSKAGPDRGGAFTISATPNLERVLGYCRSAAVGFGFTPDRRFRLAFVKQAELEFMASPELDAGYGSPMSVRGDRDLAGRPLP